MTDVKPPPSVVPNPTVTAVLKGVPPVLGALLVLAVVGVTWIGVTGGRLGQTAAWNGPVAYPDGLEEPTSHHVTFTDDTVYFTSEGQDGRVWITAVDAETGVEKWSLDKGLDLGEDGSAGLEPGQDTILLQGYLEREGEPEYLIDAETGDVHELTPEAGEDIDYLMVAGMPVRASNNGDVEVLDSSGGTLWKTNLGGGSDDSLAAVTTADDLGGRPNPGNPIDAQEFASISHDGTVRVFDKRTGEATVEREDAVEPRSDARLVFEGVLYTTSDAEARGGQTITAYDMTDGFAEVGSWAGREGQPIDQLVPCAEERICVTRSVDNDGDDLDNAVIDLEDGTFWDVPDDADSPQAVMTYAGDTLAIVHYPSWSEQGTAEPETQLFDADFEKIGDPVPGVYTAVDDTSFATLRAAPPTGQELTINGVAISILDAEDASVTTLDEYSAYPGCEVAGAILACPTENGYRIWNYRN